MKKLLLIANGFVVLTLSACAQQNKVASTATDVNAIAFPGAEGYGKYATGGRGGKIYIVSNLNDKGPGSFRGAAETKGKRIIAFAVSGTIHLETKLTIKGDVTIAGQTAPGDGICLADNSVQLGGDNIIVRYLRFRMGDKYQRGGMVDGNGGDDAFGGTRKKNIIIDHCSLSWSTDEVFSIYAGDSTTLQWNLISEPLNYSYHFETGDKDYEHHGYGGIWGGRHLSAHHNLFAHCNNRNPRFDEHNYPLFCAMLKELGIPYPNYGTAEDVDEAIAVTKNNWLGVDMGNGGTEEDKKKTVVNTPLPAETLPVQSAKDA